jgi:hypothetical protein
MAVQETFSLTDIFDEAQLTRLITLWKKPGTTTEDICTKIIEPNMGQINEKLSILTDGRMADNYPQYIAYCCEFALRKTDN